MIKTYSKIDFKSLLLERKIDDLNVGKLTNEYFISISPHAGPDMEQIFKQPHPNVLTLFFDDVETDCYKSGEPVVRGLIFARAMIYEQAVASVKFIQTINSDDLVHIHCMAGSSRSGAYLKYISKKRNIDCNITGYNEHVYKLLLEADAEYS